MMPSSSAAKRVLVALAIALGMTVSSGATTFQSTFLRGDSNDDLLVDIADALTTLRHLFLGFDITCDDAADSNDDGVLDISDPLHSLYFLFLGTETIPAPGPHECGPDPTPDSLRPCISHGCSEEVISEVITPPFEIPGEDPKKVRGFLENGLLDKALELVLNSPGDSIELELGYSFSIPIVTALNVNGEKTYTAEISLDDDEHYEVAVGYDVAGNLGLELWEGTEANVGLAGGVKVIFSFKDLVETVRALHDIAYVYVVNPALDRLQEARADATEAARRAVREAEEALAALNGKIEQRDGLVGELIELQDWRNELNREIRAKQGELVDLVQGLADGFCGLFPDAFPCPQIRSLNRAIDDLQSLVRRVNDEIDDTNKQLAALKLTIEGLREAASLADDALVAAEKLFIDHDRVIDALIGKQDSLGFAGAAVELSLAGGGDVQLSALPGVDLQGLSLSGELAAEAGTTVRVAVGADLQPSEVSVTNGLRVTIGGSVGAGVEVEGTAFADLTRKLAFAFEDGLFKQVDESMAVTLDGAAQVALGIVVASGYIGVGRQLKAEFVVEAIDQKREAILGGLAAGDLQALFEVVRGLEVTLSRVDRLTAGGGIDVSFSVAGGGGGVKAVVHWTDVGQPAVLVLRAAPVADWFEPTQVEEMLDELVEEFEKVATTSDS